MPGTFDVNTLFDNQDNTDNQDDAASEEEKAAALKSPVSAYLETVIGKKTPSLSVDDFTPKREAQQRRGRVDNYPETGNNDYYDYYPAFKEPLQTGTYSGSMVGSNPIYSTAALMPYGLIDNRQNAIARAADAKVAEQDAYHQKVMSLMNPQTELVEMNPDISKKFQQDVADLPKRHLNADGQVDWKSVVESGDMAKTASKYNGLVKYDDMTAKFIAQYEHEVESGQGVRSPYIENIINDVHKGVHQNAYLNQEDPEMQKKAAEIYQIQAVADMPKVALKYAKEMPPDVIESFYKKSSEELYDMLVKTHDEKAPDPESDKFQTIAKGIYKNQWGSLPDGTAAPYDEWAHVFSNMFGKKHLEDGSTANTKESGHGYKMTESDLTAAESTKMTENATGGTSSFAINNSFPMPVGTKPFIMLSGTDAKDIQGHLTAQGQMIGNKKVVPSEVGVVYQVHKKGSAGDGSVIPEGDIAKMKAAGFTVTANAMAILSVYGEDDKGNEYVQGTVATNIENVVNGIQEKDTYGKYKSGVDVDILKKKAAEKQKYADGIGATNEPMYEYNGHSATKADWMSHGWTEQDLKDNAKIAGSQSAPTAAPVTQPATKAIQPAAQKVAAPAAAKPAIAQPKPAPAVAQPAATPKATTKPDSVSSTNSSSDEDAQHKKDVEDMDNVVNKIDDMLIEKDKAIEAETAAGGDGSIASDKYDTELDKLLAERKAINSRMKIKK